jgi:hypothetical protein
MMLCQSHKQTASTRGQQRGDLVVVDVVVVVVFVVVNNWFRWATIKPSPVQPTLKPMITSNPEILANKCRQVISEITPIAHESCQQSSSTGDEQEHLHRQNE